MSSRRSRRNAALQHQQAPRHTVVDCHWVQSLTIVGSVAQINMNPTLCGATRLNNIANQFQNYRLTALRFRGFVPTVQVAGTGGTSFGVFLAWVPGQANGPTSLTGFENRIFHHSNSAYTTLTPAVKAGRDDVRGQFPWYKCDPASVSVDANEDEVGSIWAWCTTASATYYVELWVTYEFKDPVDPAVGVDLALLAKEKARLKKILGIPDQAEIVAVPQMTLCAGPTQHLQRQVSSAAMPTSG